jgi:hypothetical protein
VAGDRSFPVRSSRVRLLPEYDVYVMGFRERDQLVPQPVRELVASHGRGRYEGAAGVRFVLVDGIAAGLWERERRGRRIELQVRLARPPGKSHRTALEREAERIGAVGPDAFGEFGAGLLLDLFRHLRLHETRGALLHQGFEVDAIDEVEGIEHVALRLGHLLPMGVTHQAVDVDLAERHVAHELEAHHDHAGHPEENDVETGDEDRCRIEGLQFGRLLRPPQSGERPEG